MKYDHVLVQTNHKFYNYLGETPHVMSWCFHACTNMSIMLFSVTINVIQRKLWQRQIH